MSRASESHLFENPERSFTLFSERKTLGEEYEKWRSENHVLLCGDTVISWLESNGLLNVTKAIQLARKLKERVE